MAKLAIRVFMIKPILYHSFAEKEALEKKLMAEIPLEKRKSVSQALADIFYNAPSPKSTKLKTVKK